MSACFADQCRMCLACHGVAVHSKESHIVHLVVEEDIVKVFSFFPAFPSSDLLRAVDVALWLFSG